jgi:hypothetical protein
MSIGFPIAFRSAQVRLALIVIAIVALGGLVIGVRARLKTQSPDEVPASAKDPVAVVVQSKSPATRLPTHVITLRPDGFDPAAVLWAKGKFFLTIDNRSNVNEITLLLERQAGSRVKEIKSRMRKERSAGVLDLPPGDYLLTEANHPQWVCRIKISPH